MADLQLLRGGGAAATISGRQDDDARTGIPDAYVRRLTRYCSAMGTSSRTPETFLNEERVLVKAPHSAGCRESQA